MAMKGKPCHSSKDRSTGVGSFSKAPPSPPAFQLLIKIKPFVHSGCFHSIFLDNVSGASCCMVLGRSLLRPYPSCLMSREEG